MLDWFKSIFRKKKRPSRILRDEDLDLVKPGEIPCTTLIYEEPGVVIVNDYAVQQCEDKKDRDEDLIQPHQVVHPDPLAREVIARTMSTGNIVIGGRNDDGSTEIHECDIDE